jgi:hypothetical protein
MRAGLLWIALSLVSLLAIAAPAAASSPYCVHDRVTVRPDRDRAIELDCGFVSDARLGSAPGHGTVSDLRVEAGQVRWTHRADPGAPAEDAMTLELSGDGVTTVHELAIEVIPLSRNTAPVCDPVQVARRGPGDAPVEVSFFARCRDAEHDRLEMEGAGPGTFTFAPPIVAGGTPAVEPSWTYRTATYDGAEQATLSATDELGARSAPATIDVRVGPGVSNPPACVDPAGYLIDGGNPELPVLSRPGAIRSFTVSCTDTDFDPMELRVTGEPARGDVTAALEDDYRSGSERTMRWRLTYTPREPFVGLDELEVTTNQVGGATSQWRIGVLARDETENERPRCSAPDGSRSEGGDLLQSPWVHPDYTIDGLRMRLSYCSDEDGDELSYAVTSAPRFGSVEFEPYGAPGTSLDQISFYNPGRVEGPVEFSFSVSDGVAAPALFRVPFAWVNQHRVSGPPPPSPAAPPSPATPLTQARAALKTRSVRLVRRLGQARVYARAKRPKVGRTAAPLAVVCAVECRIGGRMQPFAGKRRAGRRSTVTRTGRPGAAVLIQRRLSPRERRSLRRAGGGVVETRLSVRHAGGRALATTVRLGMRR